MSAQLVPFPSLIAVGTRHAEFEQADGHALTTHVPLDEQVSTEVPVAHSFAPGLHTALQVPETTAFTVQAPVAPQVSSALPAVQFVEPCPQAPPPQVPAQEHVCAPGPVKLQVDPATHPPLFVKHGLFAVHVVPLPE
jgi:hypothetical protein